MYEKILLPTDGSAHSTRAIEHGAYLAQRFGASVRLLHVVDVERAAGLFDAGGIERQFVEYLIDQGEDTLDATAPALQGIDAVERAIAEGEPSAEILEQAEAMDADLIAMGTHGRTGMRRYLMGSVTERVVRRAETPVLTVRSTDRNRIDGDYGEILVPTDGSSAAEKAVEHALAIAERAGARVHSVFVINEGELRGLPADMSPSQMRRGLESIGAQATQEIADEAAARGLDTRTDERVGLPASELLDYVDEKGIDLIAMGTAGQTGPSRFLLGSTAERIIRHAPIPVLAVNARDEASG